MAFDHRYVSPEPPLWRVDFFLLNPIEAVTNLWEGLGSPHMKSLGLIV